MLNMHNKPFKIKNIYTINADNNTIIWMIQDRGHMQPSNWRGHILLR